MSARRLLIELLAVLAFGCNRTPAEPIAVDPPKTASAETGTPNGSASAKPKPRCVVPTSETPAPAASAAKTCPKDPQGGPPFAKVAKVSFPDAHASVDVELALSDDETERGLMYRTSMDAGHGMLFAMPEKKEQTFWMHNTCIPLDMMFLDDDGYVVGILENVPTLNDDVRSVPCPSSYVLEVNAGWCRQHGVRAGQTAVLPSVHPAR